MATFLLIPHPLGPSYVPGTMQGPENGSAGSSPSLVLTTGPCFRVGVPGGMKSAYPGLVHKFLSKIVN